MLIGDHLRGAAVGPRSRARAAAGSVTSGAAAPAVGPAVLAAGVGVGAGAGSHGRTGAVAATPSARFPWVGPVTAAIVAADPGAFRSEDRPRRRVPPRPAAHERLRRAGARYTAPGGLDRTRLRGRS